MVIVLSCRLNGLAPECLGSRWCLFHWACHRHVAPFPTTETLKTVRSSGPCGAGGREACSPALIYGGALFWPGPARKMTAIHAIQKIGWIPIPKYKIC